MKQIVDLAKVTVVYVDDKGTEYRQPLGDITEVGTLIDPDTGDDLEMSYVEVV